MAYTFEHIETVSIDPSIVGNSESTVTTFKCEKFLYYAHCFQGIVQFIKGERPNSYLNWEIPPSEQEIQEHDARREDFNEDHSTVQNWLGSL